MEAEFWLERWNAGQIGFHQPRVNEYLERHWTSLDLAPGSRAFVPLCGKSLDLLWLRDRGHPVAGVELSALAVEAFLSENGIPARRRTRPPFELYELPHLDIYCGDFFALTRDTLGAIAAVYDRAALISWSPVQRPAYVKHLTALTGPGCETLLITLEYAQAQMAGPPFSVPATEVAELYGDQHSIRELSRQDVLANEPRMRGRGVTQLHEVCYRLTRRSSSNGAASRDRAAAV